MRFEFNESELRTLISDAVKLALLEYECKKGIRQRYISERKAVKIFGSRNIKRWKERDLITAHKGDALNSKINYDIVELEHLLASNV